MPSGIDRIAAAYVQLLVSPDADSSRDWSFAENNNNWGYIVEEEIQEPGVRKIRDLPGLPAKCPRGVEEIRNQR